MKSLLIAASVAAALFAGLVPAAEAKTTVRIFFGLPHYTYQVGPDYRYRRGYGWYRHGHTSVGRVSCGRAKARVINQGFRNVSTVECSGSTYTFRGIRKGKRVLVYVNSRTGAVWRG